MRALILVGMAVFLLAAGAAVLWCGAVASQPAPLVGLSWNDCCGSPGALQNMDYSGDGEYALFVSATGLAHIPGELWFGHAIELVFPDGSFEGAPLPDFWRFDGDQDRNPTGCATLHGGEITYDAQAMQPGCPPFANGPTVFPVTTFDYYPESRIGLLDAGIGYLAGRDPESPSITYLLWKLTFTFAGGSIPGPESCSGSSGRFSIGLLEAEFVEGPDVDNTRSVFGSWGYPCGGFVLWNDTYVGAQASTWGRLKGSYR
jgi:hypothetical protein